MKVGMALGGGVARGLAHIGVMQILEEHGVVPQCLAGTSAGSIMGAALASGLSSHELQHLAEKAEWWFLARPVPFGRGMLSSEGIEKWVLKMLPVAAFEDLEHPLAVVAADFASGAEVVLREGDLAHAVRASCTIPGVYEPVERDGRHLIDGGVVRNLPVTTVRELGADFVVAVDLHSDALQGEIPKHPIGSLLRTANIMMRPSEEAELRQADVAIQPRLGHMSPLAFRDTAEFVRLGREAAVKVLPDLLGRLADAR